jgi:hypothetical protein
METRTWEAWGVQLPNGDLASGGTRPATFARKREASAWIEENDVEGWAVKGLVTFTFEEGESPDDE